MKIRTDFVTNSSSSSFCVEVKFKTDSNAVATMRLEVSPETCFSDDGYMTGRYISLHPDNKMGDVCFSKKSIYEISNIDELCDLLFSTAKIVGWCNYVYADLEEDQECEDKTFVVTGKLKYYGNREKITEIIEDMGGIVSGTVSKKTDYLINNDIDSTSSKNTKAKELGIPIITELEFMKMFDSYRYDDVMFEGETVSVSDVAPKTIEKFKKQCKSKKITMQNLSMICIRNQTIGNGDSAKWVDSDNSVFAEYKHQYDTATKEEKEEIINKMLETLKKGIELPVNDNEYILPETMFCVLDGDDTILRKSIEKELKGKFVGCWMAALCHEHIIDVATKKISSREVLLLED